jgi:hypothetical protein
MYDLVITGGTVVDGTGTPARLADIAVQDGIIAAVVEPGALDAAGREHIDATGLLVTPGFVDIHTHYDGQATWDPFLSPSCWHGVTTVVAGNCGVGFAPAAPDKHEWLVALMEGVEDIPGSGKAEIRHTSGTAESPQPKGVPAEVHFGRARTSAPIPSATTARSSTWYGFKRRITGPPLLPLPATRIISLKIDTDGQLLEG